ncbi:MAG: putative membrane protein [Rickettsiales bacterium]|jgi:uncharacterized membrane protein
MKNIFIALIILSIASCISYRPIFNPNDKYNEAGNIQANKEADICMEEADQYLKDLKSRRALKEGVRSAGWGSFIGGIFGFIFGGNVSGLVTGVAVGAGFGAASGAGGVLAEDNLKPDQLKQRYVTSCLNKKGYNILGWE